jgi:alanyl-tRNA synthetase
VSISLTSVCTLVLAKILRLTIPSILSISTLLITSSCEKSKRSFSLSTNEPFLAQLIKQQKELEKQIVSMQKQLASNQGDDLVNQAQGVNGVSVLASVVEGVNGKDLRDIVDKLKDKLGSAVIVLAAVSGNKVSLVAGVTKDLTDKYQAGKILNHVAQQVGGKGGGRPDMAQGGGTESSKVDEALASVKGLI